MSELRLCKDCMQMTKHKISYIVECLKCGKISKKGK